MLDTVIVSENVSSAKVQLLTVQHFKYVEPTVYWLLVHILVIFGGYIYLFCKETVDMKQTKNLNCSFSIAGFSVLFSFTTSRWRLKNLSMAFCGAKVLQELLIRQTLVWIVWCHWFFSMSFELGKPWPLQKQTVLCINTLSMLNVSLRLDFGGSWGRYSASSSGFEGHMFVGVVWCCLFGGCVPEHLAMYASLRPVMFHGSWLF